MISDFEFNAIGKYLNQLAIDWWNTQPGTKTIATCDACSHNPINRNAGYLIGSNLWCKDCFDAKATSMIIRNPNSAGAGTLENAMKLVNEKESLEEKKRSEAAVQKKNESLLKKNEEKESIISKRKDLGNCIYCGKPFNLVSNLFKTHSNCNHIILKDGINGFLIDNRDGEEYRTVKIGNQIMMAENLRYKMPSGCWVYDNDEDVKKYGYLYDWNTACRTAKGLKGWHLPKKEEYEALYNLFFGGAKKDYYALKENGSSGFDALLFGLRGPAGQFGLFGQITCFWSAASLDENKALFFSVPKYATPKVDSFPKANGLSVRLFRDL